ncbi:MAG: hypothetical protein KH189_06740 [Methanobrevibacter smithii]|nr:hypothetical protein [Methanobrevibacter smithii]MBS6827815.1 hypothetical protein [Methanobrevibacter smithii]
MIEDNIGHILGVGVGCILGVCVGCILFLIYEVFNLYKKIERINIDIDKLQNKDIEFNRRIDYFIDKLNKVNDSIKEKV